MPARHVLPVHYEMPDIESRLDLGFDGMEIGSFPDLARAAYYVQVAKDRDLWWGIHFPFLKPVGWVYPSYLSADPGRRMAALTMVLSHLTQAAELGAHFFVLHCPKPSLFPNPALRGAWRVPEEEVEAEEDFEGGKMETILDEGLTLLDGTATQAGVRLLLEQDGPNPFLYAGNLFAKLLADRTGTGFCLDIGRLHHLSLLHRFDALEFARTMAPVTDMVHLWNTRVADGSWLHHYPAGPEQQTSEGWGDAAAMMKAVFEIRPDCPVNYEFQFRLPSLDYLKTCMEWVEGLRG